MLIPIVTINICIAKGLVNVSSISCAYLCGKQKRLNTNRDHFVNFIISGYYSSIFKSTTFRITFRFFVRRCYALTLELLDVCVLETQFFCHTCHRYLIRLRLKQLPPFLYYYKINVRNEICKQITYNFVRF